MKATTKREAAYMRRVVLRAVREAERIGKPLQVQSILWRIAAEECRKHRGKR